jgi:hypothetical protein
MCILATDPLLTDFVEVLGKVYCSPAYVYKFSTGKCELACNEKIKQTNPIGDTCLAPTDCKNFDNQYFVDDPTTPYCDVKCPSGSIIVKENNFCVASCSSTYYTEVVGTQTFCVTKQECF